jgi:hypothetical protein
LIQIDVNFGCEARVRALHHVAGEARHGQIRIRAVDRTPTVQQ